MEMEVDNQPKFIKDADGTGTSYYGSLRFLHNEAAEYGPEIASVARELVKFGTEGTYMNYYNGTVEQRQ